MPTWMTHMQCFSCLGNVSLFSANLLCFHFCMIVFQQVPNLQCDKNEHIDWPMPKQRLSWHKLCSKSVML